MLVLSPSGWIRVGQKPDHLLWLQATWSIFLSTPTNMFMFSMCVLVWKCAKHCPEVPFSADMGLFRLHITLYEIITPYIRWLYESLQSIFILISVSFNPHMKSVMKTRQKLVWFKPTLKKIKDTLEIREEEKFSLVVSNNHSYNFGKFLKNRNIIF